MDAELQNLFLAGLPELCEFTLRVCSVSFRLSKFLVSLFLAFHSRSCRSLDCKHGCKFESNEKHHVHVLHHTAWRTGPRQQLLGFRTERAKLGFQLCC